MSSYPQACAALAPPPDPRPLLASKRLPQLLTIKRFRNNARRDNLERFWKGQFGYTHGILLVDTFYENVKRHDMEHRELAPGQKPENVILQFQPNPPELMYIACLWSHWTRDGEPDLLSFAAITDEPPPEVRDAGHDRMIIRIKPEHVDAWLNPDPKNLKALYDIFDDRTPAYYEHRLAA